MIIICIVLDKKYQNFETTYEWIQLNIIQILSISYHGNHYLKLNSKDVHICK